MLGPRGRAIIHQKLQKVLAELISKEVIGDRHGGRKTAGRIPPDLLVQHVASTFILVLNWWVGSKSPLSAKDVNELFRALILPTMGNL